MDIIKLEVSINLVVRVNMLVKPKDSFVLKV